MKRVDMIMVSGRLMVSLAMALILAGLPAGTAWAGTEEAASVEGAVTVAIHTNQAMVIVDGDGTQRVRCGAGNDFNGLATWNAAKGQWNGEQPVTDTAEPPVYGTNTASFHGFYMIKGTETPRVAWEKTWELLPPDGFSIRLTRRNDSDVPLRLPRATIFWGRFGARQPVDQERFGGRAVYDFGPWRLECEGPVELQSHPDASRLYWSPLTLDPGEERTQSLRVRVAPGRDKGAALAPAVFYADLHRAFAAQNPHVLHWPDRRPIMANMSCKTVNGYRLGYHTNPRGWNAGEDVTTTNGFARFRAGKLAEAHRLVGIARQQNAQGVIIWDLEGEECRHAITYKGSPDRLMLQAPEMDEVADEYFAIIAEAGLRAGVCIRPQRLGLRPGRHPDVAPDNQNDWQHGGNPRYDQPAAGDEAAVLELLADKIAYAYGRWKVTLFYIDSPVGITAAMLTELARRFADCLLVPEYPEAGWYGASAPLFLVNKHARHIWPEAFGTVCVGGFAGGKASSDQIRQSLDQGCILIANDGYPFRSLYDATPRPEWHDPSRFQWNGNQPVSRALTQRWIELNGTKDAPKEETP